MAARVEHSRKTDEWGTPDHVVRHAAKLCGIRAFDLDPAVGPSTSPKACAWYLHPQQDGLALPWQDCVWLNPPYSQTRAWLEKAVLELRRGSARLVCALIAARTDTRAWQDVVHPFADDVYLIRGRIKFEGAAHGAPFPSALVKFTQGSAGQAQVLAGPVYWTLDLRKTAAPA